MRTAAIPGAASDGVLGGGEPELAAASRRVLETLAEHWAENSKRSRRGLRLKSRGQLSALCTH